MNEYGQRPVDASEMQNPARAQRLADALKESVRESGVRSIVGIRENLVVAIFSLVLGEHSYGLIGALFAVPILSMIQVVFIFFYRKSWQRDRSSSQSPPVSA